MPQPATDEQDPQVSHDVEWRDPASLKAHPKNARRHTKSQLDMLAASIERFGITKPILIDQADTILAGHGTVRAAMQLGIAKIPVVVAIGWSDEEKRAYLLADNRLGDLSAWDKDVLAEEVSTLKKIDAAGLFALGFNRTATEQALRRATSSAEAGARLGDGLGYAIVITCKDENDQRALLQRFQSDGLQCKAIIS